MAQLQYLTHEGELWVAERLVGSGAYSTYDGQYVGWGTSTAAAAKTMSSAAHIGEVSSTGVNREAGAISVANSATASAARWQNVATLSSGWTAGTTQVTTAGVFGTQPTGAGVLLIVGTFDAIPISTGESIQFTFSLDPAGC